MASCASTRSLQSSGWARPSTTLAPVSAGTRPTGASATKSRRCARSDSTPDDGDKPEDEPDWEALIYDAGPVTEHREGPWGPNGRRDVLFLVTTCMGEPHPVVVNDNWPDGFNFCYGANNLWIEP